MKYSSSVPPLLGYCFALCLTAHAQTPTPPPDASQAAPAKALPVPSTPQKIDARTTQKMVDRILREVSVMRQLPIKRTVKSSVVSRAQVEKMLSGAVKNETPPKELVAAELFLRQLALAPANFHLKQTYISMMGEQIGGYYDNRTKAFTTTDRVDPLLLETVMAHELTHALQDQNFGLNRLGTWPEHDSDAKLAMSALVEGDATLSMSRYMARNPLRALGAMVSSMKTQGDSPTFNTAPRILRDSVTFPYIQGLSFASNLYQRGRWASVSGAFKNLPQSSEQILHFDKYESHEAPVPVPLRDLTPQLGKGWTLLDHDVNGEYGLFLVVAEHLKDDDAARAAAAGWAGDRYEVYQSKKGGVLVVQDCLWDSLSDATQWRSAYARATTNRFGFKSQQRGALQLWNASPNGVWMEQRGNRVVILEGTVGAFNPASLFTTLWK